MDVYTGFVLSLYTQFIAGKRQGILKRGFLWLNAIKVKIAFCDLAKKISHRNGSMTSRKCNFLNFVTSSLSSYGLSKKFSSPKINKDCDSNSAQKTAFRYLYSFARNTQFIVLNAFLLRNLHSRTVHILIGNTLKTINCV